MRATTLTLLLLLAPGVPAASTARAVVAVPTANHDASEERRFTLPLLVPEAQLRSVLRSELAERRLLRDFQIVTSKFSEGRVLLDHLDVRKGPRPGTARLEARGRLRFDRKQLGVKWRGFKSHKKWYAKGAKDVADARVTCVIELGETQETGEISVSFTRVRVKLVSRVSPARGLTVRFDAQDRLLAWKPKLGSFAGLELRSARIDAVETNGIRLAIELGASCEQLEAEGLHVGATSGSRADSPHEPAGSFRGKPGTTFGAPCASG